MISSTQTLNTKRSTEIKTQSSQKKRISMITRIWKEGKDNLLLTVRFYYLTIVIVEEKPPTFINRPLSRAQLRKKHMRRLRKSDLNWRDTNLLCKFMNDTGKILNKYQTRLPTNV